MEKEKILKCVQLEYEHWYGKPNSWDEETKDRYWRDYGFIHRIHERYKKLDENTVESRDDSSGTQLQMNGACMVSADE